MTSLTVASIVLRTTSAFHLTWLVLLIVQKNSGVSFYRPISTTKKKLITDNRSHHLMLKVEN